VSAWLQIAERTALDVIFSDPELHALVTDVRINFGGADPCGLAIASRLANAEYLAYTKEARADPVDRNRWTPGDATLVRRSPRPGFRGPVVELIGPLTISLTIRRIARVDRDSTLSGKCVL
jgi:hypothetical protein